MSQKQTVLKRHQFSGNINQLREYEEDIWDLCKELEELGGGIQTRLERISSLKVMKKDGGEADAEDADLPPYFVINNDVSTDGEDHDET